MQQSCLACKVTFNRHQLGRLWGLDSGSMYDTVRWKGILHMLMS